MRALRSAGVRVSAIASSLSARTRVAATQREPRRLDPERAVIYEFRMPGSSFRKDQFYTRPEVAALVGRPKNRWKGGDWDTGYSRWNDEFFIFCNVGIPGKTGHDY